MDTEVAGQTPGESLFRKAAIKAAGQRLFAPVAVVMPPSAIVALLVAFLTIAGLIVVATLVEVPLRVRAVGVLMPPGGFLHVVAAEAGQVADVHAADGQRVQAGDLLVDVAARDTMPGESLAQLRLRSLQNELELLRDAHIAQQDIRIGKLSALRKESEAAQRRLLLGNRRLDVHRNHLALLQSRVARLEELAAQGHVSRDAIDREQATLLSVRSAGAELERQALDLQLEIERISRSRQDVERQMDLDETGHRLDRERLNREIGRSEYQLAQGIRAPADSIVARVLVRPGVAVSKGQVVAKLYRPGEQLEAWLYLSSTNARLLRAGQSVQLRLDAYPKEVFGTRSAVVSSVSGVALVPDELSVPLALGGPVFEVKATLPESQLEAYGSKWPLAPGTSFKADVIQRRFRLYEWLFRSILGSASGTQV